MKNSRKAFPGVLLRRAMDLIGTEHSENQGADQQHGADRAPPDLCADAATGPEQKDHPSYHQSGKQDEERKADQIQDKPPGKMPEAPECGKSKSQYQQPLPPEKKTVFPLFRFHFAASFAFAEEALLCFQIRAVPVILGERAGCSH
jgi:hypothetical protein